jgi:hypothetical protein
MYEFISLLDNVVYRLLMCLFMGERDAVWQKITGNFTRKEVLRWVIPLEILGSSCSETMQWLSGQEE